MKVRIRFYLSRPNGDTETVIYSLVNYKGYSLKYYTDESILPKYWDGDKKSKTYQRAKPTRSFPEHPEFNNRLDDFCASVKKAVRRHMEDNGNRLPSEEVLKKLLDVIFGRVDETVEEASPVISFMQFFADFIKRSRSGERVIKKGKRKGKPITEGTVRTYDTTYNCIADYESKRKTTLLFEDITISKFYPDFKKFCMLEKKQSNNYIGKHFKTIKSVMGEAMEDFKLHNNRDYESDSFVAIKEEVDGIALSVDELAAIKKLDLEGDARLERTRDWFLIGCNIGQRVSDTMRLTAENIAGDYIAIKAQQKGKKPVKIPINDTIREILAKNNGTFPARVSDQKFNDALKDLGKKATCLHKPHTYTFTKGGKEVTETAAKYEFLSSHAMRRSFATNEYKQGTDIQLIMAITGHTTEANFYKYIKEEQGEKAERFKEQRDRREKKKSTEVTSI